MFVGLDKGHLTVILILNKYHITNNPNGIIINSYIGNQRADNYMNRTIEALPYLWNQKFQKDVRQITRYHNTYKHRNNK